MKNIINKYIFKTKFHKLKVENENLRSMLSLSHQYQQKILKELHETRVEMDYFKVENSNLKIERLNLQYIIHQLERKLKNTLPKHDDPIIKSVLVKIRKRSRSGMEKFGKTMAKNNKPLEEWILDTQEELFDAANYLERILQDKNMIESKAKIKKKAKKEKYKEKKQTC